MAGKGRCEGVELGINWTFRGYSTGQSYGHARLVKQFRFYLAGAASSNTL